MSTKPQELAWQSLSLNVNEETILTVPYPANTVIIGQLQNHTQLINICVVSFKDKYGEYPYTYVSSFANILTIEGQRDKALIFQKLDHGHVLSILVHGHLQTPSDKTRDTNGQLLHPDFRLLYAFL
jgi:hypothetical protein